MKQSAATERVQKVAVSILIDHNTRFTEYSFEMALVILNIDPLEVRKYYVKSLSSRHLNLDMLIYLKPIKISIKKIPQSRICPAQCVVWLSAICLHAGLSSHSLFFMQACALGGLDVFEVFFIVEVIFFFEVVFFFEVFFFFDVVFFLRSSLFMS